MLKLLKFLKYKPQILTALLVGIFVLGSFGFGEEANAQWWVLSLADSAASTLLGGLFTVIIAVLGLLLELIVWALTAIVKYNDFINAPAVNLGWTLVRDVANLFFVVVLLIIALGTILRLESYSFKKMLPKILMMAVLVNFSLVIAGVIIDAAQVVMLTFVAAFDEAIGSNIFNTLHVTEIVSASDRIERVGATQGADFDDVLVNGVLAVLFLFIALIVVGVITLVLLARMVALWLLLVLAPLPYILYAFPFTKKYAQQWWDEFIKYVIVGPSMAFFLWLAFAVVNQSSAQSLGLTGVLTNASAEGELSSRNIFIGIGKADIFFSYMVSIAMLLGGLIVTQKMGVAGGNIASSGMKFLRKIPTTGINALGRQWDRTMASASINKKLAGIQLGDFGARVAGFLSPTAVKKGWAASRHEVDRAIFPKAEGRMSDFFNKKIHHHETFNELIAFQSEVATRVSEIMKADLSEIDTAKLFDTAIHGKDQVEIAAAGRVLLAKNQFDDYSGFKGEIHSPEELRKYLRQEMDGAIGPEMSANIAASWSNSAETLGKYRVADYAATVAVYDKDDEEKIVGSKNVWLDDDYAREELERENRLREKRGEDKLEITDETVAEKAANLRAGEWKKKNSRSGIENWMREKEGKMYREVHPKAKAFFDFLSSGTKKSNFGRWSKDGIRRGKEEDGKKQGEIVDTRRQAIKARYKETVGVEEIDGKRVLNIEALADAFRTEQYEEVTNAISHSGLSIQQLAAIQPALQAMGIKGRDGAELKLTDYAGTNAKKILENAEGLLNSDDETRTQVAAMLNNSGFVEVANSYRKELGGGRELPDTEKYQPKPLPPKVAKEESEDKPKKEKTRPPVVARSPEEAAQTPKPEAKTPSGGVSFADAETGGKSVANEQAEILKSAIAANQGVVPALDRISETLDARLKDLKEKEPNSTKIQDVVELKDKVDSYRLNPENASRLTSEKAEDEIVKVLKDIYFLEESESESDED